MLVGWVGVGISGAGVKLAGNLITVLFTLMLLTFCWRFTILVLDGNSDHVVHVWK